MIADSKNIDYEIIYNFKNEWLIVFLYSPKGYEKYNFYYKYNIPKRKLSLDSKIYKIIPLFMLLIILSIYPSIKISNENLYQKFYTPYNLDFSTRFSIPDDYKDFKLTHFYLANLYQKNGKYTDAIKEYKLVVEENNSLFVLQSQWYMGLCYLKLNQNDKAIEQFKKLSNNKNYYQLKAKRLIRRIQK